MSSHHAFLSSSNATKRIEIARKHILTSVSVGGRSICTTASFTLHKQVSPTSRSAQPYYHSQSYWYSYERPVNRLSLVCEKLGAVGATSASEYHIQHNTEFLDCTTATSRYHTMLVIPIRLDTDANKRNIKNGSSLRVTKTSEHICQR
jgi:hypothetical protein